MKQRAPIPRKAKKPKRKRPHLFHKPERDRRFQDSRSYVTKGGRVRLFGKDYEQLRWMAYHRSMDRFGYARCECGCEQLAPYFFPTGYKQSGELSHNEHGARKSDELHRVKWMRHECHARLHNPKSVPSKRVA